MPPPVMAELLDEMIAFFVAEFQAVIYMIPANPKANPIISIEVQFYQKRLPVPKIYPPKFLQLQSKRSTSSALDFALARAPLLFATSVDAETWRWNRWNRTENPKIKEFVPQKRDHF